MMKKLLLTLVATTTIAGGMLASSSDAEARPYGRYYGVYRGAPVAYGYRRYGYYPRWGRGPFYGMHGGWGYPSSPSFEREVALLIRDRKNGQLLYEARASNAGPSASIDYLLPAMFEAAMKDFPGGGPNPRQVTTQISKQ